MTLSCKYPLPTRAPGRAAEQTTKGLAWDFVVNVTSHFKPTCLTSGHRSDPDQISIADASEQNGRPPGSSLDIDAHSPTSFGDARAWLAAIAESSDDAIVGKDLNGVVTSWDAAAKAMFGFTSEEIVGQSIYVVIPPDRTDEEDVLLSRIRRGEKVTRFETNRKRKDGTIFPVSITVSPIKDDSGTVIGISKIARDLTEREKHQHEIMSTNASLERFSRHLAKARDLAERSNRAKSRFLATMSHELRTP